ncbi:hypothetical protein SLEP1_g57291 [Rubroshorea leprosula]|uniref:Uncharacterized protein n=1 Tax=Rubroshorea leprosula TaxID=152421 RepID=A0AAV5MKS5_9ROSI|nr:hypothetical protein SLEP1_g57291 [Rubroshorea leprosula]
MADAVVSVSAVLEQLTTVILEEARPKVRLIKGAPEEIDKVRSNLESIRALLVDAEERGQRDKNIKLWLRQLKEASLDMEDVLDEWNTALLKWKMNEAQNTVSVLQKKVCHFISCFCLRQVVKLHGVAVQIKKINRRLGDIAEQKDRYSFVSREVTQPQIQPKRETTSFVDGSVIHGRDEVKKRIISHLLCGSSEESSDLHLRTISIVGMGGIGKTALAQILYNDDQIKSHFDKRVWVCISDLFDEARVARAIIIELEGQAHASVFLLNSLPFRSLLERICDSLEGKKFFMVLDDVWTEDGNSWDSLKKAFKHGAPGSRILVTTRKDTVVKMMESSYVFPLEELSQELSKSRFTIFVSLNAIVADSPGAIPAIHGAITSTITHVAVTAVTIASGACLSTKLIEANIRVDHNDPREFCIGDLENLCHLGRLWVKLVGNSIDADEARRARLHDKIHLQEMKIDLDRNIDRGYAVETLNPPSNLNCQFWTRYTDWY